MTEEVTGLNPGTALDIGSGEGADAIWLARQGWNVTAVEPSKVALDRAKEAAAVADAKVTWVHSGFLDMPGGTGTYDLVSAQYPVLDCEDGDAAITALLAAVAPGGTLLFVHHEIEANVDHEHDFDPADFVMPDHVAAYLDDSWQIKVHQARSRPRPAPDNPHVRDVVLRAQRIPSR